MRLLNVHNLQLENFDGAEEDIPPYAILSHTWNRKETSFGDLQTKPLDQLNELPEFQKVKQCCKQAKSDSFTYVWIDTCCIDKSSSSELSEAINSMFKWYQQSSICYVYLEDFQVLGGPASPPAQLRAQATVPAGNHDFCASRWFERGFTLQELIAPRRIVFFDKDWTGFGSRDEALFDPICRRTRILPHVFTARHCMCSYSRHAEVTSSLTLLRNGICRWCKARDNLPDILSSFHGAVIFNWASQRDTTRKEDAAYSLIGLFNVNLPLLYGEGERAFLRLQSAILNRNNDHSLLLWRAKPDGEGSFRRPGCLSLSPRNFELMPPIVPQREYYDFDNEMVPRLAVGLADSIEPVEVSETLLGLTLWMCPCEAGYPFDMAHDYSEFESGLVLGILNCHVASDYMTRPALLLSHVGGKLYRRIASDCIFLVNPRQVHRNPAATTLSFVTQSLWWPVHRMDMARCTQESIKLLVRSSGPSLLRERFNRLTSTDPVCMVVNQHPRHPYTMSCRILGGYPQIYGPDSCPPTMPLLRSLERYSCHRGPSVVGGIHLFELRLSTDSVQGSLEPVAQPVDAIGRFYVVWGLYPEATKRRVRVRMHTKITLMPWCRIFRVTELAGSTDVPSPPEFEVDGVTYQKQIHAWLVKRSTESGWRVKTRDRGHRAVLPDLSVEGEGAADRMLNLFPDSRTSVGLSARMHVAQGFGVRSNDIELTILTPDDQGWQQDCFDGSIRDQDPLVKSQHRRT